MEKLVIKGGKPLFGDIEVSGMKNAALPVILASILVDDICVIENIPNVSDVALCFEIIHIFVMFLFYFHDVHNKNLHDMNKNPLHS